MSEHLALNASDTGYKNPFLVFNRMRKIHKAIGAFLVECHDKIKAAGRNEGSFDHVTAIAKKIGMNPNTFNGKLGFRIYPAENRKHNSKEFRINSEDFEMIGDILEFFDKWNMLRKDKKRLARYVIEHLFAVDADDEPKKKRKPKEEQ